VCSHFTFLNHFNNEKIILILAAVSLLSFQKLNAQTNDFYDDAETVKLKTPAIEVLGEIANPGKIATEALPLRSVNCKRNAVG